MSKQGIANPITFKGQGAEWFGIWIVNILLSIVTLGVYSAWAKVRTKRYFYGNTYLAGDNFEYHAKPIQILKGRLVALAVVLIWAISNAFFPVLAIAFMLVFYMALPWLLWSNARFDSAMTSYRNVHFSFNSTLKSAYVALMGRALVALLVVAVLIVAIAVTAQFNSILAVILGVLSALAFAVLYGWVSSGVCRYFTNGYRYGNWQFSAEITTEFFIKLYLKALALGIASAIAIFIVAALGTFGLGALAPALAIDVTSMTGVSVFVYTALIYLVLIVMMIALTTYTAVRTRNYVFAQLQLQQEAQGGDAVEFSSSYTVGGYMWLVLSNFLLQVVTLGLARPWVMIRASRYVADNTVVVGDMSLIKTYDQDSAVKSAITDEVAQAFDLGVGIG
ncbi:YjgN family protein [Vibrio hippocampi]|uniref:DUF898 domain-containing protein n=1 Tax=Vibrio hippocampi TaxID=654686 RepID=A0ABN8DGG7_9VIBR|nr:YjgN family protein [Vibrio hippocampi]CAH0526649.1 hypothetical protein VHP8226_02019 [Vibrio hippocampi]